MSLFLAVRGFAPKEWAIVRTNLPPDRDGVKGRAVLAHPWDLFIHYEVPFLYRFYDISPLREL